MKLCYAPRFDSGGVPGFFYEFIMIKTSDKYHYNQVDYITNYKHFKYK